MKKEDNQERISKKDILKDKFKPKKISQKKTIERIQNHISNKGLKRMKECATYIELVATQDLNHKKVLNANMCGNRFCPICSWNKSRKDGSELAILMSSIHAHKKYKYIFLTLTVPNVQENELNDSLKDMSKAFNLLTKQAKFKNSVNGYVRKIEVTYNSERNNFHPHIHTVLAVDNSYFTNTKKYIKQKTWLEMWQKATGMDNITQVDVRRVDEKGVAEISKYSAKDSQMNLNQEVFDAFYNGLKGKRLIVFGGIFKEYKQLLKDGKLDSFKEIDTNIYVWFIRAIWTKQEEYDTEVKSLTQEQTKLINKHNIKY